MNKSEVASNVSFLHENYKSRQISFIGLVSSKDYYIYDLAGGRLYGHFWEQGPPVSALKCLEGYRPRCIYSFSSLFQNGTAQTLKICAA